VLKTGKVQTPELILIEVYNMFNHIRPELPSFQ